MKFFLFLLTIFICLISACHNTKKNPEQPIGISTSDLSYQIYSDNQSDLVRLGETLKLQIQQRCRDFILSDTRNEIPFYQIYDSTQLSRKSYMVLGQLRKGDSVVFRVIADSAFKTKRPALVRKTDTLLTCMKVLDIIWDKAAAEIDYKNEIGLRKKRKY